MKNKNITFQNLENLGIEVIKPLIASMGIYLVKNHNKNLKFAGLTRIKGVDKALKNESLTLRNLPSESLPNDTFYPDQWSLNSNEPGEIKVREAWKKTTGGQTPSGQDIVVAIVDSGFDHQHADLKKNLWTNVDEIPGNGIDDDGNGYIDDTHGWNAYLSNGNIKSSDHGSHVGGIIGAKGNNDLGITGLNWDVSLMPVSASSSKTSVILEGYGYVLKQKKLWLETNGKKGANVVVTNSSFGVDYADCSSEKYSLWNDIYNEMGKHGILSVAATANSNVDIDQVGDVPTGCSSDYIISVTNLTRKNTLSRYAGYGQESIDLAAPGSEIYSSIAGNDYDYMSGTSMATPHVAGAIALGHSYQKLSFEKRSQKFPGKNALKMKESLLESIDKVSDLKGKIKTEGKLNLSRYLDSIHSL